MSAGKCRSTKVPWAKNVWLELEFEKTEIKINKLNHLKWKELKVTWSTRLTDRGLREMGLESGVWIAGENLCKLEMRVGTQSRLVQHHNVPLPPGCTLQSLPIQPTVLGYSFPLGRTIANDQNGKSLKPILLTWAFLFICCLMDSIWKFEHKMEINAEQVPTNDHQFLESSLRVTLSSLRFMIELINRGGKFVMLNTVYSHWINTTFKGSRIIISDFSVLTYSD